MAEKAGAATTLRKLTTYCFLGAFVFFTLVFSNNLLEIHKRFMGSMGPIQLQKFADINIPNNMRKFSLTPPSTLPYNLSANFQKWYIDKMNTYVLSFFKNKTNGIFLEAGVNDGETMSHTLRLEKDYNWTGLIVECNPALAPVIRSRNRKAWFASACLGSRKTPGRLNFSVPKKDRPELSKTLFGSFGGSHMKGWDVDVMQVETVPLFSLLDAVKLYEIDYFSFDIEAAEFDVLRDFPFHLVKFKVIIMEVSSYSKDKLEELERLLFNNGYSHVNKKFRHDRLYVHESAKRWIKSTNFG